MSESHTPGPWEPVDNSWEVSTIYDLRGFQVAECHIDPNVDEETQGEYEATKDANARLIAAAPELLETLIGARNYIADRGHSESCGDDSVRTNAQYETCGCFLDNALEHIDAIIAKATGEEV